MKLWSRKETKEPKFYGFDLRRQPKPYKVVQGRRTLSMISPRVEAIGYMPKFLCAVASLYPVGK